MKIRVLCSIGTRPEAIKMAPVIDALAAAPWAEVRVLATGQHRELLEDVNRVYNIQPHANLDVMRPNQTLPELTGRLATALDELLEKENPRVVLAQGDTTSVFMTSLACFYRKIPFGHVEAGLRTGKRYYPFPEEINRVLTSRLTAFHFAPTKSSEKNLLHEGIDPATIHVTGNTVIDALYRTRERARAVKTEIADGRRLILMTAHRRENFGPAFREVCLGARDLVDAVEDAELIYPVHPNPNVVAVANEVMGGHPRIRLVKPMDHLHFVAAMDRASIIITDSGGIQEEAPALGKPVLVFRRETERPEAVEEGCAKLVGPDRALIAGEGTRLMREPDYYKSMAKGISPYGDGKASERIVEILRKSFVEGSGPEL